MSDQDRYIPGVPCWIDINQPDPEAAVAFYGGLFGWEFEDVTPPGAPVKYFLALLPGGPVAGVASQPEGMQRAVAWDTYVWVADADETAAKVRAAGGTRAQRALRRRRLGTDGAVRRPRRRRVLPVAGERASRRGGRQRARVAELQRPPHARPRRARARSTERCSAGSSSTWAAVTPGRSPATATSSSSATPGCARAWRRWARRSGSRTSSRASRRSRTTRRRTGA